MAKGLPSSSQRGAHRPRSALADPAPRLATFPETSALAGRLRWLWSACLRTAAPLRSRTSVRDEKVSDHPTGSPPARGRRGRLFLPARGTSAKFRPVDLISPSESQGKQPPSRTPQPRSWGLIPVEERLDAHGSGAGLGSLGWAALAERGPPSVSQWRTRVTSALRAVGGLYPLLPRERRVSCPEHSLSPTDRRNFTADVSPAPHRVGPRPPAPGPALSTARLLPGSLATQVTHRWPRDVCFCTGPCDPHLGSPSLRQRHRGGLSSPRTTAPVSLPPKRLPGEPPSDGPGQARGSSVGPTEHWDTPHQGHDGIIADRDAAL